MELNKVELVNLYFYTFVMASLDSMFLHKDYNKGFALFYWFYMLTGVCFILFAPGYYKLISTTFMVQPLLHYCQFYGEMYDFKKSVKFKLANLVWYSIWMIYAIVFNPTGDFILSYRTMSAISDIIWSAVEYNSYFGIRAIKSLIFISITDLKEELKRFTTCVKLSISNTVSEAIKISGNLFLHSNNFSDDAMLAFIIFYSLPIDRMFNNLLVQVKTVIVNTNKVEKTVTLYKVITYILLMNFAIFLMFVHLYIGHVTETLITFILLALLSRVPNFFAQVHDQVLRKEINLLPSIVGFSASSLLITLYKYFNKSEALIYLGSILIYLVLFVIFNFYTKKKYKSYYSLKESD